jgi:transcriptional regulator with XRE-family HTH domain
MKAMRLSIRGLATKAVVSKSIVQRLLEGGGVRDPEDLKKLAEALECTVRDLQYPSDQGEGAAIPVLSQTDATGSLLPLDQDEEIGRNALRESGGPSSASVPVLPAFSTGFAVVLGPVSPDLVSRDPSRVPWMVAQGDVIIFRPARKNEMPADALVVVAMDESTSGEHRRELRLTKAGGGRTLVLHSLVGLEPLILKKGWEIEAVAIEMRRLL